jgi:hypothetical protein
MQMPPTMPRNTLEPKVALSALGAVSAVYMALATSSPPTLKPCAGSGGWCLDGGKDRGLGVWLRGGMRTWRALLTKKRSGASAPMESYLGVRAMARHDTAMRRTVHMSAVGGEGEGGVRCG